MISKSERKLVLDHGWVEIYRLQDYNPCDDENEIIKIVASTIYQKDSESFTDISKLKTKLYKEGALGTPSRVFEFIPYILKNIYLDIFNNDRESQEELLNLLRYGYTKHIDTRNNVREYRCYTNFRNVSKNLTKQLKCYDQFESTGYENFVIVKMFIPMFIRDQFMTHTQLSKLNRSYRVSPQNDNKYWLPEGFHERFKEKGFGEITNLDGISKLFGNDSYQTIMHDLGYPKEIWTRFGTQSRYGEMVMAGWLNDPNGWQNFFLERGCLPNQWNNWVQKETKEVATAIYSLINEDVERI